MGKDQQVAIHQNIYNSPESTGADQTSLGINIIPSHHILITRDLWVSG